MKKIIPLLVSALMLLSLAASPPEGVPRDELVTRIWPRAEGEEGRHRMRQAMYRLRQLTIPIQLRGGHLSLDWPQTDLDVHLLLHGAPRREPSHVRRPSQPPMAFMPRSGCRNDGSSMA